MDTLTRWALSSEGKAYSAVYDLQNATDALKEVLHEQPSVLAEHHGGIVAIILELGSVLKANAIKETA